MFDKLDKFNSIELNKISFSDDFVNHLKNRHINSNTISEHYHVSRKHSYEMILSQNVIKQVSRSEKYYRNNKLDFFEKKCDLFFKTPGSFDLDTVNSLVDGYYYFYDHFIKHISNVNFDSKCLICDRENVSLHWDHVIPKSVYPMFSLIPINLIKICYRCNDKKSNKFNLGTSLPFHPMFESINVENLIDIIIDFDSIAQKNGMGFVIRYRNSRLSNLIKLYDLTDIVIDRVKRQIKGFIIGLLNTNPDSYNEFMDLYNPQKQKPDTQPVDIATDRFITDLTKQEIERFKEKSIREFFRVYI